MKLVSVIISAYNCEKYVEEAVRSILNQTYQHLEVVIADDGSTDGTMRIIDGIEDNRIVRHHNVKNMGLLRTWNKLIPLAKGEYITWQDADDRSYPTRIQKLVAALDNDPELVLCGSNICRPYPKWNNISTSNFPTESNKIKDLIANKVEVPFPGTRSIIRREVLCQFTPFREFYIKNGWEDFDLFCQVSEKYKVGNIPDVLYEYRYYPQSASKIKLDQITSRKVFIEEIGFFLAEQRKQNNGLDGLMPNGDKAGLELFLQKMEAKLEADRSLPYRRIVRNKCSNKDFIAALKIIPITIKIKPISLENWKLIIWWQYCFTRAIVQYLNELVTNKKINEYRRYNNNVQ